ncbi:MAG: M1 family metallopeptidase [Deltaproteobacteria bacterium]|nr:M1 family metallopeptidase [Deltaproteobacteria bacterium]
MNSNTDPKPINYHIQLEPDFTRFEFSGKTQILIDSPGPVREISMNALELAIWQCQVNMDDQSVDCSFSIDPAKEELRVFLPDEMSGPIQLDVDYAGKINDKMAGFYRSRTVIDGIEKYVAVTQFEESDARRAFPCFDHPTMKATFDVEIIVDKGLQAISNCPVSEEQEYNHGKMRVKFQQTPKMSTYLLFFGVGEFEFIDDAGEVDVRAATMPGMTRFAEFGLEFGRKSLAFSEDYYGVKYPLPKLDLIAISDFAAGAMENWGAITFRENLLLHDPEKTSKAGEIRICEVIAHEMAHQWFGNLVTPSDWKFLWLNESFATYFGYGIVDHYYPEWEVWDQFLQNQTDTALERDALIETLSIEIPGGEHVVINTSTAPIIYNKGGSILRQVEGFIGRDAFREGLQVYLKRHAYDCAASHHLWEALEESSEKPVSRMMKNWVEQPGFPLIEVSRKGQQLVIRQKRFTYINHESDQRWLIPVSVKSFFQNGQSKDISILLEDEKAVLDLDPDAAAYKVNHGQSGFYRVFYHDRDNLQTLGKMVSDSTLPTVDRWGLQGDMYAMVRAAHIRIDEYLDFLKHYAEEDAYLPLTGIASNLYHAFLVLEGAARERIKNIGKILFENVLKKMGFEPDKDEKQTTSILRDQILWHAVLYGSEEAGAYAMDSFSALMQGHPIHPDIMKSAMRVGALKGDERVFEWFRERFESSHSEHERINILLALGSFREKALIDRACDFILKEVPSRNKFMPITALTVNPHAIPHMWDWYMSSLESLEQFHPVHYERVIAAIVPIGGIGKEASVTAFFKDYMDQRKKSEDVIKLSLEKLQINSGMRAASLSTL